MSLYGLKNLLAVTAMIGASALFAHDAKLHASNATEGQIVSIKGNEVVMKTAKGDVRVTISKDTKFEMGNQAVNVNHFKKGDKVGVIGTKLASGVIVAKEVLMVVTPAKGAARADDGHKH